LALHPEKFVERSMAVTATVGLVVSKQLLFEGIDPLFQVLKSKFIFL
jgi:hypothetical protein